MRALLCVLYAVVAFTSVSGQVQSKKGVGEGANYERRKGSRSYEYLYGLNYTYQPVIESAYSGICTYIVLRKM